MASPPSRAMGHATPTLSAGMCAAPGPSYRSARCISTCATALTCDSQICPGLFPGLGGAFHGVGDIVVKDMGIFRGGLDIGMAERLLDQFQVAARAQQFGREVMPEVMEAETGHASTLAQIPPVALYAVVGDGIALAFGAAVVVALRNESENVFVMVAAQWP